MDKGGGNEDARAKVLAGKNDGRRAAGGAAGSEHGDSTACSEGQHHGGA